MCHEGLMRTSLETASEISGGLSSGLQTHPHQTPYTLVQIKRQLSDHNILGVPTQMRDAPTSDELLLWYLLWYLSYVNGKLILFHNVEPLSSVGSVPRRCDMICKFGV